MSELLQNWLNNEVGLSTNVSNFEKDFSSGYLFGEILHKFWQADFEQFQNKNSHQAKIANFKTLEPILKALGIKFNATLINAVMNGERGAALRLLYQLKMASERSERPVLALQASALEMQASVGWPGASMKVRQARVEKLTRKFELEKHKQEIVAYEMDNIEQAHVEEQRQIHRFSLRERLRQNRAAKDEWEARGHELWQDNMKVRMARETEQMRFSEKVYRTQQEKEQQQRQFATSEVLQGTKDFETGLQTLGITRKIEEKMSDSSGDDDDETAERLLAQTSKVASAKELVEALQAKLPTNQELNYEAGLFMRKIKESKQAGTIARRERERRRRRVLVEQQREQEMLEENQLEQVLMEKLSRESIEESAISYRSWRAKTFEEVFVRNRQARQQQYIARKKADKEEALKWDQDLRDEMIETLREQEERERVRYRAVERLRHAKRREKLREEMEGILELIVQMAFADIQQEQLTDKEEVDSTLWREWVALFEENLPVMPLPSLNICADEPAPLTALPEPTGLANLHSVGATLNAAALRDFMDAKGQWQVPMVDGDEEPQEEVSPSQPLVEAFNAEAEVVATLEEAQGISFVDKLTSELDYVDKLPVNYRFGMLVASMIDRMYKAPAASPPPTMPEVPLRLVLTGKPYAGKKTVARRLAEVYNLEVIDVDEVVRESLAAARPDDYTRDRVNRELQVVGEELQSLLDAGKVVPDELYVKVVVTKIRALFPPAPAVETDAADAAVEADAMATEIPVVEAELEGRGNEDAVPPEADATVAPGPSAEDTIAEAGAADLLAASALMAHAEKSPDLHRGWILVGFPDDGKRLALLERFLSGFVHPKARPTPKARELRTEAEVIAPRPPEEVEPLVRQPGGYDLHFRLNLTLDESVRRACGRRIDPTTLLEYHIEDMPPPNKKAVIYERLVPADSLEKSMGTLTQRIHCFDIAQPEVNEILEHFGPYPDVARLVEVNAMNSADDTFEAVEEQVAMLLDRKRADIARAEEEKARQAAEEAAKEEPVPEAAAADAADTGDADAPAVDAAPADADPDAAETTDAPPEPPFEAVKLNELPGFVEKIEDPVFNMLMEEWNELQGNFVSSLQQLFNWHRCHLSDFRSGLFGMKQRFAEFLQRTDDKQDMVDDFVLSFNLFTEEYPDMRKQDATKAELHLRTDELRQRLMAEVEKHSSQNLAQLEVLQTSRWLESQTEVLASQVQHAVQLEVKRYHACCQLLTDFYYSALCLGLPEEHEPPPKVDVFSAAEPEEPADPKDKKKKDDKKKAKDQKEEEPEISPEEKAAARLCKFVPDEEPSGEGRWEFPFLADLMDQATKALWKLEDFAPPSIEVPEEEEKEDPKAKAKAKGKAKAKEKPKKEEEVEKPPPQPAPALFVDLQQALLAERVTFRQRLQMVHRWAVRRLHQAASSTKTTFQSLNDWVLLRRTKDLEAVACLVDVIKEQVENEEFIKTKLCLNNAHLHQRPNTLLRAPIPPKVPPPVEGIAPFRWTMEQLENLLEVVNNAAAAISPTCRMLPNYTMLGILQQLSSADGSDKRTVKVPANWRNSGEAKLKQLLASFEHIYSASSIDIVDFLLHMCLLHSPSGWPALNTLMEVRKVLEAQAPKDAVWPDFYVPASVVESLPLFDEQGEESFAKKFKAITSVAPKTFDRCKEQLRWVAKVLQRYRAPSCDYEAWRLEVTWYDYRVQRHEESERLVEMLDDVRSTPADTPRQPPIDNIPALLGHEETENPEDTASVGGQSTWSVGRPEKPRPEEPVLREAPRDHISVRQLMAYLCQGPTTEDGLARAFAVLAPGGSGASLPLEAAHRAVFALGCRPLPSSSHGDGRPEFPAVQKFGEELDTKFNGSSKVTGLVGKAEAQELIKAMQLGRRHRRAEVEKIFPKVK